MAKPQVPQHGIIPLLMQKKLPPMAKAHVRLAILINVRRIGEGARHAMQIKDAALADVDEETYVLLASIFSWVVNIQINRVEG
jgi:hypothetical protein